MKVNIEYPSTQKLLHYYNLFQSGQGNILDFIKTFQWVRFDPRYGEILVHYIYENWSQINPIELGIKLKSAPWPQVFGVLADHVKLMLDPERIKLFNSWEKCVLADTKINKEYSIFYIGIFKLGGPLYQRQITQTNKVFTRWGYYSSSLLIPEKKLKKQNTQLSSFQRLNILTQLAQKKKYMTVTDYIQACDNKISRRTGEMDLLKWCRKTGNTKGSRYTFKKTTRAN